VARPRSVLLALLMFCSAAAPGGIRSLLPVESNHDLRLPPPKIFVLAVAIEQYRNAPFHIPGIPEFHGKVASVLNAGRISETIKSKFPRSSVETTVLADSAATKDAIAEAVRQFARRSSAADMFIFSFSGATFIGTRPLHEELYLAPYGAQAGCFRGDGDCSKEPSLISGTLLYSWMTQLHAQRQVLLLDANATDTLLPVFENRWKKEACSVGPNAMKRMLIITNHTAGYDILAPAGPPVGALTFDFLHALSTGRASGIISAFWLQQQMYTLYGSQLKRSQVAAAGPARIELFGGDFILDGPAAGIKQTDLLLDSGLGPLCYESDDGDARGFAKAAAPPPTDPSEENQQPTNYAVLIATDHYTSWPKLSNPIFDADTIEHKLQDNYGFKVEHLYDPTRDQLRKKLDDLHTRPFNDGDQLVIFIAGHGDYDETNDIGYLVFPETPMDDHEHDREMNLQELRQRVDTIKAKHILLVMDSCFAGSLDPALGGAARGLYDPISLKELRRRSADKTTRYFLTSGGKEYVPDGTPGNHSPFASLFITALDKADISGGYLNLSQLPHYFERLATVPRAGNLGHNQDGADFFFVPTR
jgi:uncharacterized caspase-like protein